MMRIMIILLLCLIGCAEEGQVVEPAEEIEISEAEWEFGKATLVRVVDGDTLVVSHQGETKRVRLIGVDTPERDQHGFAEATQALEKSATADLYLIFEVPNEPTYDEYGRTLAFVFNAKGVHLNADQLKHRGQFVRYYAPYRLNLQ